MEQAMEKDQLTEESKTISFMFLFWMSVFVAFVVTAGLGRFWGVSDIPLFVCPAVVIQQLEYKPQMRYFDLCVYIFLTVIAVELTVMLSLCGIFFLWPGKFSHDFGIIPIYNTPFQVIKTVLSIGVVEGVGMSVVGCLMKLIFHRKRPEKKHPLVAAMEPRSDD